MELGALALVFVLGACIGSFLNVLIFRYGFREYSSSRSVCMSCDGVLGAYDLIPLVSYVILGGRCRHCGSGISPQYPLVELASGLLFVGAFTRTAASTPGTEFLFALTALFWVVLLALVVYDLRHTLIPLPLLGVLSALTVILTGMQYALGLMNVWDALLGAAICGGFFGLLVLVTRGRGMGLGDALLAAILGLFLGVDAGIAASVIAVWIATIVGVSLIIGQSVFQRIALVSLHTRVTLKSEIPFAPFLALGALIVWGFGLSLSAFGIAPLVW